MSEYTGGSVSYYSVLVENPTLEGRDPYTAECNDIIEALGMNYAEGNAFKALWRRAAARTLGLAKAGYTDGLYAAEKVEFFGARLVAQSKLTNLSGDTASPVQHGGVTNADGWIKWDGGECPVGTVCEVRCIGGGWARQP